MSIKLAMGKFYNFRVRISRLACAGALHVSLFMGPLYHKNRQYNPRSLVVSRVHWLLKPPLYKLLGFSVTYSQRGWDMFCLTLPKRVSHEEETHKVQAGQTNASKDILELMSCKSSVLYARAFTPLWYNVHVLAILQPRLRSSTSLWHGSLLVWSFREWSNYRWWVKQTLLTSKLLLCQSRRSESLQQVELTTITATKVVRNKQQLEIRTRK